MSKKFTQVNPKKASNPRFLVVICAVVEQSVAPVFKN